MITVSIITINLNNYNGVKKTVENVVNQKFRDYEFLIVDGASTDDSLKIINQYSDKINWYISEKDTGIYNAMNKGIRHAKGEYCLFLNSGDWFSDEHVLARVFAIPQEADIISGDIVFFDSTKQKVKWIVPSPDMLTARTLFMGTLPHQATFIKRALYEKYGLYNEQLEIASDWLFFVESLLEHNCTYKHYKGLVSFFNMEGVSCRPETHNLPLREKLKILNEKYPRFIPDYERLKNIEEEDRLLKTSIEFKFFLFLTKIGFIKTGVIVIKSIKSMIRILNKLFKFRK